MCKLDRANKKLSMLIDLKYLLKKLELIKGNYDFYRQNEEKFNIFSVLYKNTDEIRLHSRFIAALLDPFASHGMDNFFLNKFINSFEDLNEEDYQNAVVYPSESDKSENSNIDILIIDRTSKHAIVIENKIYARDSNNANGGQLERYYEHVRDKELIEKGNIKVFYLSLDEHFPSPESLGKYDNLEEINGQCLSYKKHIIKWLSSCMDQVVESPFLRESILQYQKLIKKMSNDTTNLEERKELFKAIGSSSETMEPAKYLIDNFNHIKWLAIDAFWKDLENELHTKKYQIIEPIDTDSITNLTQYSNSRQDEEGGIVFRIKQSPQVSIYHEKGEYLYWKIDKKNVQSPELINKLDSLVKKGSIEDDNYCWWKFFILKNGEHLFLKNFTDQQTFDLINEQKRREIIKDLSDQLESFFMENNLIE